MNKILTIVTSLTFVFLEVSAQINPMQGYIITKSINVNETSNELQ